MLPQDFWPSLGYQRADVLRAIQLAGSADAESELETLEREIASLADAGTLGLDDDFFVSLAFGSDAAFERSREHLGVSAETLSQRMEALRRGGA